MPLRKSPRNVSPGDHVEKAGVKQDITPGENVQNGAGWNEPLPRVPAPSFEDHKGVERHGVLENMQPLGTPPPASKPNAKNSLRLRHYEGSGGKFTQTTLGEGFTTGKGPTKNINESSERSVSQKIQDLPLKPLALSKEESEQDMLRLVNTKPVSTRFQVLRAQEHSARSPTTPLPFINHKNIELAVEFANTRSKQNGDESTGLAIKHLYEDSRNNPELAILLNAILSRNATRRQEADFRTYIKVKRKKIKAERKSSASSSDAVITTPSKSISESPSVKVQSADPPASKGNTGELVALEPSSRVLRATSHPKSNPITMKTSGVISSGQERPPKRQKREKSASSSSSLSSLNSNDPEMMLDEASVPAPLATPAPIPIPAPVPVTSAPAKPTTTKPTAGPKLHLFSTKKANGTLKRPAEVAGLTQDANFDIVAKRRLLQKTFDDYKVTESNIRTSPKPTMLTINGDVLAVTSTLPTSSTQQPRLLNGTHAVDDHESLRSSASSVHGDLLIPPPPGAMRRSRGVTPTALGRPPKQLRKTARIKVSPMKKKTGVIAGVGRMGGGRDSPVGYGYMDDNGDHDNVDYCTACSGNGQLLCCDGCTRSFHFTCLDPPVNPNHPPEGQWYCYICESKRDPQPKTPRGVFSALLDSLDKRNPIAYNLPLELRDYFEGVKTGEEGEYEEVTGLGKLRTRAGYDESPDNFKLKDAKGSTVLCFKCGKSSMGKREIICCDYCTLRWHLDCLDPPLANAPVRVTNDGIKLNWMCPVHIDHELQALNSTDKLSAHSQHVRSGRIHKARRPKNARIVDTALRRGFANNGMIEIENDETDDEEDAEKNRYGTVYRLSEQGIKLDFIDRVKQSHEEETLQRQREAQALQDQQKRLLAAEKARREAFDKHSLVERKTALNLVQFAQKSRNFDLDPDRVENLISTLIAEAPADVLALDEPETTSAAKQSSIPPTPPGSDLQEQGAEKEIEVLEKLEKLIRRRKGALGALAPEL